MSAGMLGIHRASHALCGWHKAAPPNHTFGHSTFIRHSVITYVDLSYVFQIHMGLHTLRLGTFPKPFQGKAAMKDVKVYIQLPCVSIPLKYLVYCVVLATMVLHRL